MPALTFQFELSEQPGLLKHVVLDQGVAAGTKGLDLNLGVGDDVGQMLGGLHRREDHFLPNEVHELAILDCIVQLDSEVIDRIDDLMRCLAAVHEVMRPSGVDPRGSFVSLVPLDTLISGWAEWELDQVLEVLLFGSVLVDPLELESVLWFHGIKE